MIAADRESRKSWEDLTGLAKILSTSGKPVFPPPYNIININILKWTLFIYHEWDKRIFQGSCSIEAHRYDISRHGI